MTQNPTATDGYFLTKAKWNIRTDKPDVYPFWMDERHRFLEKVLPFCKEFFIVAFFTGMRFGEMAGLKR